MEANMNPTHAQRNRSSRIKCGVRDVKIKARWNNILSPSIWFCRNYKIKAPRGPMVKVTKSRPGNASFSESPLDTLIQSHHNVEIQLYYDNEEISGKNTWNLGV